MLAMAAVRVHFIPFFRLSFIHSHGISVTFCGFRGKIDNVGLLRATFMLVSYRKLCRSQTKYLVALVDMDIGDCDAVVEFRMGSDLSRAHWKIWWHTGRSKLAQG